MANRFSFGDFELDASALELRRDGRVQDVQLKVVDLLLHLLRNRDRVVEKDELFAALWPDEVVSEASLTQAVKTARRVLGDDGASQRFIKTIRGRGYRFIAEDVVAPDGLSPAQQAEPRGSAPVTLLSEASRESVLEALFAGSGRLLLVSGAAGAGKSSYALALAEDARTRGARILRGVCADEAGAPPGWPLARALEPLVEGEGGFADAIPLFETWLEAAGSARGAPVALDESQRFSLGRAIAEGLSRARERGPLVVVLEDVHHADPLSVELIRAVGLDLETSGLLLVLTCRSGPELRRLSEALGDLRTKRYFAALALEGLGEGEVARLIEESLGEAAPARVVTRLTERSGGNPWQAGEILRHWKAAGLTGAGRWGSDFALERAGVPEAVDAALRAGLAKLSPRTRELVEVASVFEAAFLPRHLQQVAEAALSTVTTAIDEARDAAVFERHDSVSGAFGFQDPALRDAVHSGLAPARRRELHRRAARRLELENLGDSHAHWDEIARHYFEAVPVADVEKCMGYLRSAAEAAEERGAVSVAEGLLERALIVHEQGSAPSRDERRRLEAALARVRS